MCSQFTKSCCSLVGEGSVEDVALNESLRPPLLLLLLQMNCSGVGSNSVEHSNFIKESTQAAHLWRWCVDVQTRRNKHANE